MLRELCNYKGVEISDTNAYKDHIHMLVSIPPKLSISAFVGYLKVRVRYFNLSSFLIYMHELKLK